MVHALRKSHDLLHKDGRLFDIHPMTDAPRVEVRSGVQVHLAGWLREEGDYEEYAQADDAINQAVRRGWYVLEQQDTFIYLYHADSIEALQRHLDENWQSAILDDMVVMRVQDLMQNIQTDKEIVLREPVWIGRLRPLPIRDTHGRR